MRVLYITPYRINDNGVSSGTVVSVKKALLDAGNEVDVIDNLRIPRLYELYMKALKKITKKEINVLREPYVLKKMAKELEKRSVGLNYDAVFSQTSILCAYYRGEKPIVFYTDASFGGMLDYYWNPEQWMPFNLKHGNETEKRALNNCQRAIYTSKWAANSAVKCYGIKKEKCVVINRGANIYHSFSIRDIENYINSRACMNKEQKNRFLFVGRNWERKGGPLALDIVKSLNELGYPSCLVVVGCTPNIKDDDQKYVNVIGFLNKSNPNEYKKLQETYLQADFYLQPSKQEAQGIAYAEASAFGVPVIATNTGGVSDIVTNRNGILLEVEDEADKYVEKVIPFLKDKNVYRDLAMSTYEFYEEALNWGSVGKRLSKVLYDVVEEYKEKSK